MTLSLALLFVGKCFLLSSAALLFAAVSFEAYLFPTRVHRVSSLHDRHLHCSVGAASLSRRRAFVHRASREPVRAADASLVVAGDFVLLDQLLLVAEHWDGPVVVALRVLDAASIDDDASALLAAALSAAPVALRERVDVHLIHMDRSAGCGDTELYLLAAEFARTDWLIEVPRGVFLFGDSRRSVLQALRAGAQPVLTPSTVLAMPHLVTELSLRSLPRSKRAAVDALLLGTVEQQGEFGCFQCQQPIDIDRWMHAGAAAPPYAIEYRWLFQPIMMLHRDLALRRNVSLSSHPLEPLAFAAALAGGGAQLRVLGGAFAIQSTFEATIGANELPNADLNAAATMPLLCDYLRRETRALDAARFELPQQHCESRASWRGTPARAYG